MASERGLGDPNAPMEDGTPLAFKEEDLGPEHAPSNEDVLGEEEGEKIDLAIETTPSPKPVSWIKQLRWTIYKNILLLLRSPIKLCLMIFSSVFSVLAAWPACRDPDGRFPTEDELDVCGVLSGSAYHELIEEDEEVVISLNDSWRNGLSVAVLALGPFIMSVCAFIVVHMEIEKKLLGVLRGLGVWDSIFWMSWYIPLITLALMNSLLGSITAQLIPVHAFRNIYFLGVFASLFFLQVALIPASFLLAAICGSQRKLMILIVMVMGVAVFVPTIINNTSGSLFISVGSVVNDDYPWSFSGLIWTNRNTAQPQPETTYYYDNYGYWIGSNTTHGGTCNNPIMSEEEGTKYKTEAEREQVTPDDFFIGCYTQPGFTSYLWKQPDTTGGSFGQFVLFMIPYFHFMTIYSNFLGYTGAPGKKFGPKQAAMSPEDLSVSVMPIKLDDISANGTSLFPQGSTIVTTSYYDYDAQKAFQCEHAADENPYSNNYYYYGGGDSEWCYSDESPITCPSESLNFDLCDNMYRCDYVKGSKHISGSPSVNDMLGYLVAVSIINFFLAWYWSQIFPAGNGAARKFYFFLNPRYWFGSKRNKDEAHDNSMTVSVQNVSKSFGSCEAVKNLSLVLKCSEVTALLGHNGAGKSTLSAILACEMPASKGQVSIFGRSNYDDIRSMASICKQDDFLWQNLSAKEHLDIFAGLRGVDNDLHDEIVMKWLESVDLTVNQHMFSGAFSGGMKRRLSVALATIGDRPFLIFDEPTTGMDPVSRRYVWQHIDDVKEGKVVLLTTHAMEEADLLADEVAIMKKGELAAKGSPLELKAGFGSAIQFSVLVEKEHVEETERKIKDLFQDDIEFVNVKGSDSGNITVKIEKVQEAEEAAGVAVSVLSRFVEWLENEESNVCEYGFSNSSLEEVFINITRDDEAPSDSGGTTLVENKGCCCFGTTRAPLTSTIDAASYGNFQSNNHISTFTPSLSVLNQTVALIRFTFIRKWTGRRSIMEYILFGVFILGTIMVGILSAYDGDYVGFIIIPLQTIIIATLSLMLLSLIFPIYGDKNSGMFHLMRTQGLLETSYIVGIALYAFLCQLAFGSLTLTLYYATPLFRETIIEESNYYIYPQIGDVYKSSGNTIDVGESESATQQLRMVRTPGGLTKMIAIAFFFALSMPGAVFCSSIIPGNHKLAMVIVGFCTVVAFLFPIIYTVLWLYNAYNGSLEDDYYYNDDVVGVEDNPILSCIRTIDPEGYCMSGFLNTTQVSSPEYIMNCIGINVIDEVQSILPYLCIPSYVSLLPAFGAFQLLAMNLLSDIKFAPESMSVLKDLLSDADFDCNGDTCKFPFVQQQYRENLFYFCLGALVLNVVGLGLFKLVWFPPSFVLKSKNWCSRLFKTVCCCGRKTWRAREANQSSEGIILNEVVDEKNAVENIVRPLLKKPDIKNVEAGVNKAEIDYSALHSNTDLPPIVMHKLRKVYPASGRTPAKVAVEALDLHVLPGQVLGLLGKNGSGKTTALKILSATHHASAGLALVAGHDVDCEKLKVFERLGNCPQFDVVWPSLSVGEHLEFFARLKGFPRREIKVAAKAIAEAVGLGARDVYARRAEDLSGGMRRRLSIAISFIGAPKVLLLDEPTTGLDPSTRNEIWGLVSSFATNERAIVITTHMMIEADTLCNRIAIISQGKLKVVATQQHLKDNYGSGYVLQLNLVRSTKKNEEQAMEFVRTRLHPDAVVDNKQAKTLHVHLPKDINLNKVFINLYSPERSTEGCINQFLLSQSSLEDVFISLGG